MSSAVTALGRAAIATLLIAVVGGLVASAHYLAELSPRLHGVGLGFAKLRALHTLLAAGWIVLGGGAMIYSYLEAVRGPAFLSAHARSLRALGALCGLALACALGSILVGRVTGREYMEFHPISSLFVLGGWTIMGWHFFRGVGAGFWERPIYVTMWGVSVFLFVFTFAEQHAWLLPPVFERPVLDMRVQWKACGSIVGSLNLLVYGTAYYVGERLSGDPAPARSRLAYALFGVGLLNSFTNFAHHTYHLPQSVLVKWISFLASMLEALILMRVVWGLASGAAASRSASALLLRCSQWWTAAVLGGAIALSIPPLNAVVHGTHAVTAHAMGAAIGIDTLIMCAGLFFVFEQRAGRSAPAWTPHAVIALNAGAAALVAYLTLQGVWVGVGRLSGMRVQAPGFPGAFLGLGALTALGLLGVGAALARLAWAPARALEGASEAAASELPLGLAGATEVQASR